MHPASGLALALLVVHVSAVRLLSFKNSHDLVGLHARQYQIGGPGSSTDHTNGWGACYSACQPWEDFTQSCSTAVDKVRPCTCSQEAINKQATCYACVSTDVSDAQSGINTIVQGCAADRFTIATPTITAITKPSSASAPNAQPTVSTDAVGRTTAPVAPASLAQATVGGGSSFSSPAVASSTPSSSTSDAGRPSSAALSQADTLNPTQSPNSAVSSMANLYVGFTGILFAGVAALS